MLDICLAGTAGMVPLPDRWLTTLYATSEGSSVLIDCGEGTQIALAEAKCRLKTIDAICLTHFHADHCAGLPGLLLSMGNAGREDPVTIVGPTGLRQVLAGLLVIAGGVGFDVAACEIDPDGSEIKDGYVKAGPMTIRAFRAEHVVPCLGYTISIERKPEFLPEKAEALGIPREYWKVLQSGKPVTVNGTSFVPGAVTGPQRPGIKVLYSTDTRPVKSIAEHGKGADLMILEGNYPDEEKIDKAKEWGHMTYKEAASLAAQAGARELWLTHFSQSVSDPSEYLENAASVFPNTVIGKDGLKKTLVFR